jgi:hypothetical protein
MCDTCTLAERIESYGVPTDLVDEFARKVSDTTQEAVIEHLTGTHDLMIATIMEQTGDKELRIRGRKVREVSRKLDTGRLAIDGQETEDREEFVYTLTEDASKPEEPQEDEFSALLRALFEG